MEALRETAARAVRYPLVQRTPGRFDEPASRVVSDRAQRSGASVHVVVVGSDRANLDREPSVVAAHDGDALEPDPLQ